MDTETPAAIAKVPVMTLIMAKESHYSAKTRPLTLVSDQATADALTKLIERSGNTAEVIDVPIWPNMLAED